MEKVTVDWSYGRNNEEQVKDMGLLLRSWVNGQQNAELVLWEDGMIIATVSVDVRRVMK
jgi:hypothetical protein